MFGARKPPQNRQARDRPRRRRHVNDLAERGIDILTGKPVQGTLLAELLRAGPLEPETVLGYGIAIGKALARLHERGTVHGGLSPWSIVIDERGAAILRPVPHDARAEAYLAPEQIRGETPDRRSDIFAYGALLYEMAAGQPAFAGAPAGLRAAILQQEPPRLPAGSPVLAAIGPVIADCLNKEPLARRQRALNVVTELKLAARLLSGTARRQAFAAGRAAPARAPSRKGSVAEYWLRIFSAGEAVRRARLLRTVFSAAILVAVAGLGLLTGRHFSQRREPGQVLRFQIPLEAKTSAVSGVSLSPDGRHLAYTAEGPEGRRMLWLHALDEMHASLVPDSEGAAEPFWSPDSSTVAYFADRSLKIWRLQPPADGTAGQSRVLCPAGAVAGGGTWNAAGVIVFSPSLSSGLYRISADGRDLRILLALNMARHHGSYRWPHFLPDGRHFTYLALGAAAKANGVYTGDLESKDSDFLFSAESDAVYSADPDGNPARFGYLLFVQDGDLCMQGFNPSLLEVQGKAEPFLRHVGAIETLSLAPLSVSTTGLLAYQTVSPPARRLVWVDREGKPTGALGEPGDWGQPRIAPDGRRVVASEMASDGRHGDIWLFEGDTAAKMASIPGADARTPVWSPDGALVAFTANPGGLYDLYQAAPRATAQAEELFHSEYSKYLTDWSRDGRYLLFASFEIAGSASEVWAYSLAEHSGGPLVAGSHSEASPALSPDGRWLAYESAVSGRDEIYVRPFNGISTDGKTRWQVSSGGGRMPRWRADGRELFFLAGLGSVMSAPITSASGNFRFEPPRELFETRAIQRKSNLYDVSPDGQRFLMNLPYESPGDSPIVVMTEWFEEAGKH